MLATLKMPNGIIATQSVVINGDVTYQISLALQRYRRRPFSVKVQALTPLGHLTVQHTRFTDLKVAQAQFRTDFEKLTEK